MSQWTEDNTASELVAEYASIIKGKTILTTGVTPGSVGAAYVEAIAAASPALLILVGRSTEKLAKETDIIKAKHPEVAVRTVVADLLRLKSVRKAAEEINSWQDVPHIDVVMNNAGIMAVPFALGEDGYEHHFTANHLSHFLLTNLIMDKILASEAPRVVNVSSDGHRASFIRWDDINYDNGPIYNKWSAYGQSKTANMLMALSLAEKLGSRGLLAFSLHPGLIMSSGLSGHLDWSGKEGDDTSSLRETDRLMGNRFGFGKGLAQNKDLTTEQGASTSVYASFDPSLKDHNGAYLLKSRLSDPFNDVVLPWATSPIEAEKLWRLSEQILGQKFEY